MSLYCSPGNHDLSNHCPWYYILIYDIPGLERNQLGASISTKLILHIENQNQENTTLSEHFKNPIKKSHIETQIDTPYTQIHECSLSRLGTCTSIIRGGDKLVIWIQTIPPSETMQPRMCLQHASKMLTPTYYN
jgi:hypothetical protein